MFRIGKKYQRTGGMFILIGVMLSTMVWGEDINPYPREVIAEKTLVRWEFETGDQGWRAAHDCSLTIKEGALQIVSRGTDPYLHSPALKTNGPVFVRLRMKHAVQGGGQIFYITEQEPGWSEEKSVRFPLKEGKEWQDYEILIPAQGKLQHIRLDPGNSAGRVTVDAMELVEKKWHPLEVEKIKVNNGGKEITLQLRNYGDQTIPFTAGGRKGKIEGKEHLSVNIHLGGKKALEAYPLRVEGKGLPVLERTLFLYRPGGEGDWVTISSGALEIRVTKDGTLAELKRNGIIVAVLGPVVHCENKIPVLKIVGESTDNEIRYAGEGIEVTLNIADNEVNVRIESEKECEGPVVRTLGNLEQGLLSGLEYLGRQEKSSSKLDIESAGYLRFAPDVDMVTMPLMAFVTSEDGDSISKWRAVGMLWEEMSLQPVYATPNFFDGSEDHRMSLRGKNIEATILVDQKKLEDVILWAVRKRGLPKLPKAPRTWEEQKKLCMAALNGPIKGEGGWGHCAGERWERRPFVDHASTIWRLTGAAPKLPQVVPGGSHVPNHAYYFVTGRAQEWLTYVKNAQKGILNSQKEDGSFRYQGKYLRGHFEDTASGFCGQKCRSLLEIAYLTGDMEALVGSVKTLEYMKRFRTPRGAQIWELSLHTPDILASANLVWAYVRGYELTGEKDYLTEAVRWALSGVPFVYQWSRYPVMVYATTPVYGATNWRAPNWMGLPVQWCGTVYAYALLLLAQHDQTLDWKQLAEGILIAAEQMQYLEGDVGCLPDAYDLKTQQRRPANINPCALVSLRLRMAGEVDSLFMAKDEKHRVTAPFRVTIVNGKARIEAVNGASYQVLINGEEIRDIVSQGVDVISLE